MKKWEAKIPTTQKVKERKKCYLRWVRSIELEPIKIVWLTRKQVTFYTMKYPNAVFMEVREQDTLQAYKKYMEQPFD
jgi:hypothetical protein